MGRPLEDGAPDLAGDFATKVSRRLSCDEQLRMPASMTRANENIDKAVREAHLANLLAHDPSIFLERYGRKLEAEELCRFEALRGDYEVDFYLKQLRPPENPQASTLKATVNNRRLAFLNKALMKGDFFSEESMRERAPLLFQEHLGHHGPSQPQPKFRKLSEILISHMDEMDTQMRLKDEMMREGKGARQYHEVGRDEVQEQGQEEEDVEEQEEEEEEEEQDVAMEEDGISAPQDCKGQEPKTGNEDVSTNAMETDDDRPQASASVAEEHQIIHSCAAPTEDEGKDLEGDFLRLMKERFLAGEDSAFINYAAIDGDASLDDYWMDEESRDLEEKYFSSV
ncbi:unnamed protein product [Ostreobium quekettii]|uniref:CCD97-like C-terminal domain-containing protein n=1 Tax=Ostreobium quekettii TaxID=121088 RepID=A0A8S1J8P7_9CHLO|nr:unnamed protein product [Ostreobium quekettii]